MTFLSNLFPSESPELQAEWAEAQQVTQDSYQIARQEENLRRIHKIVNANKAKIKAGETFQKKDSTSTIGYVVWTVAIGLMVLVVTPFAVIAGGIIATVVGSFWTIVAALAGG